MPSTLLTPADVVALSFVYNLDPFVLYPLLRGEPPVTERPQRLPFPAEVPEPCASCPAEAGGQLTLEAVVAQAGCAGDAVKVAEEGRRHAHTAATRAAAIGQQLVPWGDERYPPLLAHIFDPPLVLWVRGNVAVLAAPLIVALVGSRAASPYGEQAASRIAGELASRGVVVASGMARGIDGAAHRGALEAGGESIAVLGCGADVVYPPEHGALADELSVHGAVVSEYPPGTPPVCWNFPKRNRIISGLSRGVVVVEAWRRSGALITAGCALEQGREVMAVPGSTLSERHRGSHALLKCGAALVECAQDVLDAVRLPAFGAGPPAVAAGASDGPGGTDGLAALLDAGEPCTLDELAARCGESAAVLLPRLLALELTGFARRLPGGRFVRAKV